MLPRRWVMTPRLSTAVESPCPLRQQILTLAASSPACFCQLPWACPGKAWAVMLLRLPSASRCCCWCRLHSQRGSWSWKLHRGQSGETASLLTRLPGRGGSPLHSVLGCCVSLWWGLAATCPPDQHPGKGCCMCSTDGRMRDPRMHPRTWTSGCTFGSKAPERYPIWCCFGAVFVPEQRESPSQCSGEL